MRKIWILCIFLVIVGILLSTLGIFVVQPIGAVPEGATIIYFRLGLDLPFISSADGFLLKTTGSVSLLGRGVVLGKIGELISDRKIISLPYNHFLYLISTGGLEFSQ